MKAATRTSWKAQDRHAGDRLRLFSAVAGGVPVSRALYPGSFVDVAASFVFPSVIYVDTDRRAKAFFDDVDGVAELIADSQTTPGLRKVEFIAADYRTELELREESFDLLVSLYAGFVSEHCTRYLRLGGHLLVNPSHGDAAMASLDPRYRLVAVVKSTGSGGYRIDARDLDGYLIPRKRQPLTVERLHQLGRGIGYTRSPFAYLFERTS